MSTGLVSRDGLRHDASQETARRHNPPRLSFPSQHEVSHGRSLMASSSADLSREAPTGVARHVRHGPAVGHLAGAIVALV